MTTQHPRTAIVTGSSKGIGAAVAERLARDGLAVVVNYASGAAPAEALVAKIKAAGGAAIAVKADISKLADVRALFDAAETAFGGIDVLVNNAGIMKVAPLAQTTDEVWDQTIAINLTGTFYALREAAKRLREGGRIVNFSTSVVGLYQPTYAAYAATKAGIEAITHILSKELGVRRITVNAIAPGPVNTELFHNANQHDISPIIDRTPLHRLGEPDDIARAISFLVGPDGGWINGQILRANGGII
ncbi:3-oxoacyl-[acyl-carrier protein] reductase [Bradyrhizobium sp. JR7.2]|jgi:3-oxoacyl-[acyl-carrier protein] reductase|uniref:SDR family oxidoreductase n=1 Tax=Bradyrhizobium barranii TaxID=2992140 RepID=A0ABY3QRT7_9BRAD|nr:MULTISPECIES: SDR family oxidoreductase [Bradyrhizobium]UFW88582.1 SDR family oxidoreductase [Bradyrhizobium japonicum]WFT97314.1 SDR family oxidoreductase [Bradyrhizobium barranii]CUU21325.1 Dehydrogenases with different specificities related to shortchain alcohol dehydrogenases CDS [Bradyrhizobium sp.]